jgi:NAD-dependent dihydropyrimidine dehydrogenase PreA subunit
MFRKIIKIDEARCNGCGLCVEACHEGAVKLVGGKAVLLREDYCDGLGNCLPACPAEAISFEEREAAPFDEKAALAGKIFKVGGLEVGGCPGATPRNLRRPEAEKTEERTQAPSKSELRQWPIQIKLIPFKAPYFTGADLLISADCAAFSRASFHAEFMSGKITLIGCPKLDGLDYSEKLTEIIRENDLKSVTVVRMEVPCCGGLEQATATALKNSGKSLPLKVVTITIDGQVEL